MSKTPRPYFALQNSRGHVKVFRRNLYKVWARAFKKLRQPCNRHRQRKPKHETPDSNPPYPTASTWIMSYGLRNVNCISIWRTFCQFGVGVKSSCEQGQKRFNKRRGISALIKGLLASRKSLCSMEVVVVPCAPNPKLCTIQVVKHEGGYGNAIGIRRIIRRSGGFSGLQ